MLDVCQTNLQLTFCIVPNCMYHYEMHLLIKLVLSVCQVHVLVPSCVVHLPLCAKKLSIISKRKLSVKELNLSAV